MSNKRDLKKELNYVFGDIIDAALVWQIANPEEDAAKSEEVIDEAIADFDELIAKVNARNVADRKAHFRDIRKSFEAKATKLVEKINSL